MSKRANTFPMYRCSACDKLAVRRVRARCADCKANGRPQKPVVTTSHYKRMKLAKLSTAKTAVPQTLETMYAMPNSPYEKAVLETVIRTGKARHEWEHIIGHPLVLETDRRARQLAGIPEERSITRGMNTTICKSRRVS